MKSDADRGAFAAWLRAQRKAPRPNLPNGWKEAETVRRLEAAVPGVSFGAYRDIEAGNRKPTADQRTAIEAVFGAIPDFTGGAGDGSTTAGLSALIEQISELVNELQLARQAQAEESRLFRDALVELGVLRPAAGADESLIEQARAHVAEAEADLARQRSAGTLPPQSVDPDETGAERQGSRGDGRR